MSVDFKRKLFLLLAVVLSVFLTLDLFHSGLPKTHDGIDHVARIANFYTNLSQGNIIPRWAGNLNWGYGHPILMFLYPLPSYIASFFHFFGLSLADSTKYVFVLGEVLSGVFMFLWISEFMPAYLGLLAAVMYMITPYRLVDIYVRGDIGENLAFAFAPLVFFAIIKSVRTSKEKYKILLSLSFACLILSHNAISLMLVPIILMYSWIVSDKRRELLNILLHLALGFGVAAFFWIPGLMEGKYTLRDIVTKGSYRNRFVDFASLLYGPWSYGGSGQFTVQLGVLNWIGFIISIPSILVFKFKKNRLYLPLLLFCVVTLSSILLMTELSRPIWDKLLILQNFQFPWRFLALTSIATCFLLPASLSCFPAKIQKMVVMILILASFYISKDYFHANGFINLPESFFAGIYNGTTDTGESAPRWSVRFMEHRPKDQIEIIDGSAKIIRSTRRVTNHEYVILAENKTRIRENTLYFPGWEVFVDGSGVPIEYQDQANRGLITFYVDKGRHNVSVSFKETRLRLISDIISLVSIMYIVVLSLKIWRSR